MIGVSSYARREAADIELLSWTRARDNEKSESVLD